MKEKAEQTEQAPVKKEEGFLDFVKGGVSSVWWLTKKALGSDEEGNIKAHKVVGRTVAGGGVWQIIEGIATLDVVDIVIGTAATGFGAVLSEKPQWLGLNKAQPEGVVAPPTISLLALSEDQVEELAHQLGLTVDYVYKAHELAQLDDESLEARIKETYGDLLERASGKTAGTIKPKEKAILNAIRIFGEAHKRQQGEVEVS